MQNLLRRGTIAPLAFLLLTAIVPNATAQPDDASRREVLMKELERRQAARAAQPLVDVSFPGGTLAEFIAALREAAAPTPVNVLMGGDVVANHPVPPLMFQQVSIANALNSLQWAPVEGAVLAVSERHEGAGEPIYAIHLPQPVMRTHAPSATKSPSAVRVFMIRDLIEAPQGAPADATTIMEPESLLAAVDAVLASVPEGAQEPTVRYHPESATLIVTAPEQQLQAVNQLLLSVQEDIQHRRRTAGAAADRIADAEVRIRRARVEIQAIQEQMQRGEQMLRNAHDRLQAMQQREGVDLSTAEVKAMENEVASIQSQLAAMRGQLQMKQIEEEVARSDLDAARQGAAQPPAAAEAHAANYFEPVVIRARPEFIAILRAVREAMPAGGLPTINGNTDQGLTVTATEVQHAILRTAVEAMSAAAADSPQRERNNRRE